MTFNEDKSFNNSSGLSEFYFLKEVSSLYARNKKLIIASTLGSFLISCIVLLFIKRTWKGEFKIVLEKNPSISLFSQKPDLSGRGASFTNLLTRKADRLTTEVEILKSPSVLTNVFQFVQAQKKLISDENNDLEFSSWEKDQLEIDLEKGTTILNVAYKDTDKEIILPVLKKISEAYQTYSGRKKERNILLGIDFFDEQISLYKDKSFRSLKKSQEFGIEYNLGGYSYPLGNESSTALPLIKVEIERVNAANQIRVVDEKINQIKNLDLNSNEILYFLNLAQLAGDLKNPIIGAERLRAVYSNLQKARLSYKENDISIQTLLKEKEKLSKMIRNQLLSSMEATKKDAESRLQASKRPKDVIIQYQQLIGEANRDVQILNNLENQYRLVLLDKSRDEDPWELITNPKLLINPVAPQRKKIALLVSLFGFLMGLSASWIFERKKGFIYSKYQVGSISSYWPSIVEIKFNKKGNMDEILELLVKGKKFNEDNDIVLLFVGEIHESLINRLEKTFRKYLKNVKLLATRDLLEAVEFSDLILCIEKGKTKRKELIDINEKLILQEKSISGLFFLDNLEIK